MYSRTPISLVTGSLGSGKTTLLREIIESFPGRLAILVNEFGEIGIDGRFLRGRNIEMVELTGGCVCCSLTGEFEAAVREILDKIEPELIVVEATGVAEADALVFDIEDSLPEVRLDGVLCIVDGYASVRYPSMGYTARTQLEVADVVLVNKTDLMTPEEVRQVEKQVRRFNGRAVLVPTVRCRVDLRVLLGIRPPGLPRRAPVSHDQPAFRSFVYQTARFLDEEKFRQWASDLPLSVYRAKGVVRFASGGMLFNYVAGRWDLEILAGDKTELVFIGVGTDADRESILRRLEGCGIQDAL